MMKPGESVEAGPETVMQRRRGKWTAQQRRWIVADRRVAGASVQSVIDVNLTGVFLCGREAAERKPA